MAYATSADLLSRFGESELLQLTDTTESGTLDSTRVASELTSASGQMDMYLGARHALPLTDLTTGQTSDLTRICCDITRYRLWNDRASDEVRVRYEDALRVLEMIAAGKITLQLATTDTDDTPASRIQTGTRTALFTDAVWEAYSA